MAGQGEGDRETRRHTALQDPMGHTIFIEMA